MSCMEIKKVWLNLICCFCFFVVNICYYLFVLFLFDV